MVLSGEAVGRGWAVHQPNRPKSGRSPRAREKGEQQTRGRDTEDMRERGVTKRFNNASTTLQRVLCADEAPSSRVQSWPVVRSLSSPSSPINLHCCAQYLEYLA